MRAGQDPAEARRETKRLAGAPANAFRDVAKRWFDARKAGWAEGYASRVWSRVEGDVFPALGGKAIGEIESGEILAALRVIEGRGAVDTARRVRNYVSDVFTYARAERLVKADPTEDLRGALATAAPVQHRAALKAKNLGDFLRQLDDYHGEAQTRLALNFTLLTFVRTAEVRFATWDEFEKLDGDEALWRIPAERMKMRTEHLVPLAPQTIVILEALRALARGSRFVFPAPTIASVISSNTLIYALYRMGYHKRATVHGFRGTASTVLNEHGFNRDWVERQLAHVERDDVRAAYNAAEWLPQRRAMMIWWAEYLEAARRGISPSAVRSNPLDSAPVVKPARRNKPQPAAGGEKADGAIKDSKRPSPRLQLPGLG